MSLWSVDLSKWGELIRQWFPMVRELAKHGATLAGPVHVKIDSVGQPMSVDDLVIVPVTISLGIKNQMLADLVNLKPVRVHGNLSAKLPQFEWPVISVEDGAIVIGWPNGSRPLINIPALDPLVTSVSIRDDGTGAIEIQRGPDGTITY